MKTNHEIEMTISEQAAAVQPLSPELPDGRISCPCCGNCYDDPGDFAARIRHYKTKNAARPAALPDEDEPFEILRWGTDTDDRPIVDIRGTYLSHADACKLRDELNRLLPPVMDDPNALESLKKVTQ